MGTDLHIFFLGGGGGGGNTALTPGALSFDIASARGLVDVAKARAVTAVVGTKLDYQKFFLHF